jgi:large subunit ribosomal protein L5e
MKGCVDGGINIPHKPNRFPGFNKEKGDFNAKVLRGRIFGQHVADYMKHVKSLKEQNPDEPNPQFNRFNKEKLTPEGMEALYKKVHAAIRADPKPKAKKTRPANYKPKSFQNKRLSLQALPGQVPPSS